jgi:hypothetical protein
LSDQHQTIALIGDAIRDVLSSLAPTERGDAEWLKDPELAKHAAKCVVQALTDAGLQILPLPPAEPEA